MADHDLSRHPSHGREAAGKFLRRIGRRETRKLKARRQGRHNVWHGFSLFGLFGWAVAAPTLAGAFLGLWLDARSTGGRSWTLTLLLAGLGLGCINALYWLDKERKGIGRDDD